MCPVEVWTLRGRHGGVEDRPLSEPLGGVYDTEVASACRHRWLRGV
jgi:hypothetical protein